jgi:Protease inhibitor Inh
MSEPTMSGLRKVSALTGRIAAAGIVVLAVTAVAGCGNHAEAPPEVTTPPPPPPPQPPPIDVAGRWRLSSAGAGACFMTFAHNPGAPQGTIAPEGGCPGNFFTSRKWTFEHGALIIRDHKSDVLAELSFAGGRFEGHQGGGGALTLSR